MLIFHAFQTNEKVKNLKNKTQLVVKYIMLGLNKSTGEYQGICENKPGFH